MDFAILTDGAEGRMTFNKAKNGNLGNNVYLSLAVRKGSFFVNPAFGLRERGRLKNTESSARLISEDYRDALQWLLDTGKAKAVDVYAERDRTQNLNRLKMLVEVTPPSGDKVTFERFVEVV